LLDAVRASRSSYQLRFNLISIHDWSLDVLEITEIPEVLELSNTRTIPEWLCFWRENGQSPSRFQLRISKISLKNWHRSLWHASICLSVHRHLLWWQTRTSMTKTPIMFHSFRSKRHHWWSLAQISEDGSIWIRLLESQPIIRHFAGVTFSGMSHNDLCENR
jgi:hypothetical protein